MNRKMLQFNVPQSHQRFGL